MNEDEWARSNGRETNQRRRRRNGGQPQYSVSASRRTIQINGDAKKVGRP